MTVAVVEERVMLAPETIPDDLPAEIESWLSSDPESAPEVPLIDVAQVAKLAPRLARHWGHTRDRMSRIDAMYQAEVDRLTLWRDAALRPLKSEQTRTERLLGTLHYLLRQADRKLRTWSLPGVDVKVQFRKGAWERTKTGAEVERAQVALLKDAAPEFVKVQAVEKPMLGDFADALEFIPATEDAPGRAVIKSTGAVLTLDALAAIGFAWRPEGFTEPEIKAAKGAE